MQIGSCWFDIAKAELVNHENDTSWQMPEADFQVLKLMVKHRGQVLSKQQLQDCVNQGTTASASFEETLYRIRLFVGNTNATLFEAIDNQGYVLHQKVKRTSRSFMDLPGNDVTYKNTMLIISQVLLLFILLYAFFEPTKNLFFFKEQSLITQNGSLGYYSVFSSDEVAQDANPNVNHFLAELQGCDHLDWEKMFYSLSKDERVLNIALKRYDQQGLAIKNVKAIAPENDFKFIDQPWLKSMEICI
ncbi:helix-turn-helix domain-containing protein [Shewanella sp. Isolate11]|uniref:winged helix-turn-helix domain-containing protein n=1 Tax=Shewanella sp. Isolate11 TaxID=2908530 RepID=UPI001EFE1D02|nr:helix-turn-helix domain-containing protein [Shewanella sp. Isolate11]MCG9695726.1 helix-turn-helix domain-containing protein [Shewanella sp. Isolate11]